jgi:iron(III) transport system substrate-binding protein
VELSGATGREFSPKILAEREASQYLWDVQVGGPETPNFQLKPKGVYDPIKPALMLPEVLDESAWLNGFDAGYMDKERQFVYAFQGAMTPIVHVNRDVVPQSELSQVEQLIEPRWSGKIAWDDPRVTGSGAANAAHLIMVLGEDFVKQLFSQNLTLTRDKRQLVEWAVRGTYAVAGAIDEPFLVPFREQQVGLSVKALDPIGEPGMRLSPVVGDAMLVNRAPHPNAARLYLNWLLSKEGQAVWVREIGQNSRRLDVPGPAETAPAPGRIYRSVNSEEHGHYIERAIELGKDLLK